MRGKHGAERHQHVALRCLRERSQGHRSAVAGSRCRLQDPSGHQILSTLHSVLPRQIGDRRTVTPAFSQAGATAHGRALAADSCGDNKWPSLGNRRIAQI